MMQFIIRVQLNFKFNYSDHNNPSEASHMDTIFGQLMYLRVIDIMVSL